jgi:hypothetical protein
MLSLEDAILRGASLAGEAKVMVQLLLHRLVCEEVESLLR